MKEECSCHTLNPDHSALLFRDATGARAKRVERVDCTDKRTAWRRCPWAVLISRDTVRGTGYIAFGDLESYRGWLRSRGDG